MRGRLAGPLLVLASLALAAKLIELAGGRVEIGAAVLAPLAMGIVYLACAVAAMLRVPGEAAGLFVVHAACQAIHWTGPVEPAQPAARMLVWFLYFIVSMLGMSALLHFTLIYPSSWIADYSRSARRGIYLPVVLAGLIAVSWLSLPPDSSGREALQSAFFLLESAQVNVFALGALLAILVRFLRSSREQRRRSGLGIMTSGALAGFLPYAIVLASLGEEASRPFMMLFTLMPLAFVVALIRSRPAIPGRKPA